MATVISSTEPRDEVAALCGLLMHLAPGHVAAFAGTDWPTYARLCEVRDEHRRGVRITYDRGRLEFVSPQYRHDHAARSLAILVRGLCAEFGKKVKSAGSTTVSIEAVDRGLEPDECFFIGQFDAVRGKRDLDFDRDPPPDLAVEVENTSVMLDRLPVYAALKVPEVWRYRRDAVVEVHVLRPTGGYEIVAESPTFPAIAPADLARYVERAADLDDNELSDEFRRFVRQTLAPPPAGP